MIELTLNIKEYISKHHGLTYADIRLKFNQHKTKDFADALMNLEKRGSIVERKGYYYMSTPARYCELYKEDACLCVGGCNYPYQVGTNTLIESKI